MSGPNKAPFSGVAEDLKGRAACYKQDWSHGFRFGLRFAQHHVVIACTFHHKLSMLCSLCYMNSAVRILAPTIYIFFASAVPVIAFGEQLSKDTGYCHDTLHSFLLSLSLLLSKEGKGKFYTRKKCGKLITISLSFKYCSIDGNMKNN